MARDAAADRPLPGAREGVVEGAVQGRRRGAAAAVSSPVGEGEAVEPVAADAPRGPRELGGRLAGKSLPMQVLSLAVWPLLEQLLNFLVGVVDLALAGRLEAFPGYTSADVQPAMNALGVATYFMWLAAMLHVAVGVGAAAMIARAIGGRHARLARAALGQAAPLAVAMGALIGATFITFAPWFAWWVNLDGASFEQCVIYLRWIGVGMPMGGIFFVLAACLRAAGDTRTPFSLMVVMNIVNVAVSVTLVWLGLGVAGIAMGTVAAFAVGAMLMLATVLRRTAVVRLRVARLAPHWHTMKRIIRVGMPNLVESSGMWIGNFIVLSIVGAIGAASAAPTPGAHMIAIRVESMSFLLGLAMGVAAATLAGQYIGAGDPARARQAVKLCWAIAALLMGAMGYLFVLAPGWLAGLLTSDAELITLAAGPIAVSGPIQVFFASYMVLAHAMRGAGATGRAMLTTYVSTFCVRLPLAYVFGVVLDFGLLGLWAGLCIELVVRGAAFSTLYFTRWTEVRV